MFYGLAITLAVLADCAWIACRITVGNTSSLKTNRCWFPFPSQAAHGLCLNGWFSVIHILGGFVFHTTPLSEGSIWWNDLHHIISRWPGNTLRLGPWTALVLKLTDSACFLSKGSYFSLHCDTLHMKLWHYYTWNSRTWTLPMWVWVMYMAAVQGIRTQLGLITLPTQVLPLLGGDI